MRRFVWMAGAALAPTLLALTAIAVTGQFEHFLRSYLLENISFVGGVNFPIWGILKHLAFICGFTWTVPVYLAAALLLALGGVALIFLSRRRPEAFWYLGLFLTIVACATVLAPRRAHQHYLLYLVLPLTVWGGAALAQIWRDQRGSGTICKVAACTLIVVVQVLIGWRFKHDVPFMYGRLLSDWRVPYAEASLLIREHARPGDTIAMWGWQPWLFVETGRPHGTRDSHTKSQLESERQRDYFMKRFLEDMERNRPTFFVDAVGEGDRSFAYHDRNRQGYEAFPELVNHLHGRYGTLAELGSLRIFMHYSRHPHTAATYREE